MSGSAAPVYPAVIGPTLLNGRNTSSRQPHLGLGATQLTFGVLSIIVNIVAIIVGSNLSIISIGIWGGIMMVVAGAFGIAAAHQKSKCTIITTLVMSIISSLMGLGLALNSMFGLIFDLSFYYYGRCSGGCASLNGCLMVFGITEGIIAIIQSAFCCKFLSTSTETTHQIVVTNSLDFAPESATTNRAIFLNVQGQLLPVAPYQAGHYPSVMGGASYVEAFGENQDRPPSYSANNSACVSGEAAVDKIIN